MISIKRIIVWFVLMPTLVTVYYILAEDRAFTITNYLQTGALFYLIGLGIGLFALLDKRQNGKSKKTPRCRIGWHKYKFADWNEKYENNFNRPPSEVGGPVTIQMYELRQGEKCVLDTLKIRGGDDNKENH